MMSEMDSLEQRLHELARTLRMAARECERAAEAIGGAGLGAGIKRPAKTIRAFQEEEVLAELSQLSEDELDERLRQLKNKELERLALRVGAPIQVRKTPKEELVRHIHA